MSSVRYLVFLDPPLTGDDNAPGISRDGQKFFLTYIDGREISGASHGLSVGTDGLRLYRCDESGHVQRDAAENDTDPVPVPAMAPATHRSATRAPPCR
jgi:hypothetical protein